MGNPPTMEQHYPAQLEPTRETQDVPPTSPESGDIKAIQPQSEELKALIREDKEFVSKLAEFKVYNDADLGAYGRPIIDEMARHAGTALAQLRAERELFKTNKAFFYEVKLRLLNPKYRPDLNSDGRTVEDNLKNFGAEGWSDFREKYIAYSQSQADQILSDYKKETKLIANSEDGWLFDYAVDADRASSAGSASKCVKEQRKRETSEKQRKLDAKHAKDAYFADCYRGVLGMLLNAPPDATPEQKIASMQKQAEMAYEDLDPEDAKSIKIPQLLRVTGVEKLGIRIARKLMSIPVGKVPDILLGAYTLAQELLKEAGIEVPKVTPHESVLNQKPPQSESKSDPRIGITINRGADTIIAVDKAKHTVPSTGKLVQAACATEAKPDGEIRTAKINADVINDRAAEYVMTRIAKGRSVDENNLAQYEGWLSTKGDTERANALRRELAEWKSTRASK